MKANKLFVKTMIVTSVIGLIILMVVMFIGVRWILDQQKDTNIPAIDTSIEQGKVDKVEFKAIISGVIVEKVDNQIKLFDPNKEQYVTATVESSTRIADSYDVVMPLSEIKVGDIVELKYEPHKDNLIEVSIAKGTWKKSNMKNLIIDRSNRTITIGNKVYDYNEHTLILDKEGNVINIHEIGDYDVLDLKGKDNTIYSIQMVREQGYLELRNLPVFEGVIEINTNRHIPLSESMGPIPLTEGVHNIVLRMDGYEALVKEVEITSGNIVFLGANDAVQGYTTLHVEVINEGVEYTVNLNGITYPMGEPIKVLSGKYPIKVVAKGYETWSSYLILEQPEIKLPIELKESAEIKDTTQDEENEGSSSSQEVGDYRINISTDPGDAKLYINGEYKGETPYKTQLEVGEYTVTIEKEGYQTYQTNILIDNSDNQNSYRYILIPDNE